MKKILIIKGDSNGCLPVPATKGGAVQTLIEQIISQNELRREFDLEMVSFYDQEANNKASCSYPNTRFHWIKNGKLIRCMDKLAYRLISIFRADPKSYTSVVSAVYFISMASLILRKRKYDAVILENYIPLAWIIKLSNYRGKFFFHLHNTPKTDAKCKDVIQKCDGYICVSRFIANQLIKNKSSLGAIPEEKTFVLLNGIDTDIFKPIEDVNILKKYRKEYGVLDTEKIVLFAGRLSKEKGIDILLHALQGIDLSNIKLLIAGSRNFSDNNKDLFVVKLEKLSEKLGNHVVFTGYIPYAEMPIFYNIADCVVLPSAWDEPCGLTIAEAIACGKSVISTNVGGIPEIAQDHAYLLEYNESIEDELVKKLLSLLNGEKKARPDIVEKYRSSVSLENYYGHFVDIINGVCSGEMIND